MTRDEAEQWARKADRGAIAAFLTDTMRKLDALEGSAQFTDEGEQEASDLIRDSADSLRAVLEKEFRTKVS